MYTISFDTAATHRHTTKVTHESLCHKLWHIGQIIQRRWMVSNCSTHLNLIQTEDEDFELAAIRPHILCTKLISVYTITFRSQWPRGLRCRSAAARLLRSWVRIPPGAWMFVCCDCCVMSGRGLCDELITRPEESYRLCCVVVCDLETSRIGAPYIYDISRLRVK